MINANKNTTCFVKREPNSLVYPLEKWFHKPSLWPLKPALYIQLSDRLSSHFVSSQSFLGRYLIHGIKAGLGLGFITLAVSILADRCQYYVNKHIIPLWLKREDAKSHGAQLALRYFSHVVIGAAIGFAAGIFAPSIGVAVTAGIALGNVTMIANLIGSLVKKIFGFNKNISQERIYRQLGFSNAASQVYRSFQNEKMCAALKSDFTENAFYDWGYISFKLPNNDQQKNLAVARCVNYIQIMADSIDKHMNKIDELPATVLSELSLRVLYVAINKTSNFQLNYGDSTTRAKPCLNQVNNNQFTRTLHANMQTRSSELEEIVPITNSQQLMINEIFQKIQQEITKN